MKEIRRIVHEAACNYYQNNKDEMVTMEEAWAGATDITEADIPKKKVCVTWREEVCFRNLIYLKIGKGRRPLHCKSLMYEIAAL